MFDFLKFNFTPDGRLMPAPLATALQACRRHLLYAAGFSALLNLLYLAPTLYMMQIYDRVLATGGITTLILLSFVVVFALATLAGLDYVRTRLLIRAGLRLDRLLAGEVMHRLIARRTSGPDAPRVGQAMREFDTFRQVITGPGAIAAFDAPWTPIYLLFCFLLHPVLGVLTFFGAVALLLLAIANEKATKGRIMKAQEASAIAYAGQEAAAANGEVVRALGMRRALVTRQLGDRAKATQLQAEAQFEGGRYSGLIKFLRLALQSLALGTGAFLAVEGQISAGAVIAASVLLSRALQPIEQVVGAWTGIVNARSAFRTLVDLFEQVPPEAERTRLPPPAGQVLVEQVTVRGQSADSYVLKSVTFGLPPGETVGIVGPSGAGKTTLARVLAGALEPDFGAVRVDGADIRDWDPERLARHVGYLPQDSALFAGSVRDNISRFEGIMGGDPEAIDMRVVDAARQAGAHEMILRLPQGYDTVLQMNGRGLSAGQAQRIALARALYGEPPVLILDEPNSHLDAEGEAALALALKRAKERGATVLIVAHRIGILSSADKLVVLRDGAVELFGPREEVVAKLSGRSETRQVERAAPKAVAAASSGGATP